MARLWEKPLYVLRSKAGKQITIDVTSSVSPGLRPHGVVRKELVELFRAKGVERIVDFGAGALRHTFPLLNAGFQVCAVEFEEQFARPSCAKARHKAQKNPNFSTLIWPKDFLKDNRRFDAALLCYVLQTMPIPDERERVLSLLYKKLKDNSYLLYMSRFNQMDDLSRQDAVSDGYYRWAERDQHTFYREFTTEETHDFMKDHKFRRIRSPGKRGTEQIFVYTKGKATWI